MKNFSRFIIRSSVILCCGLAGAIVCQLFIHTPVRRDIHIRSFRYGKDPAIIRCNRGDTLHLTFSSDDTGHSFFIEEFDVDVKVYPASKEVMVYKPSNPSEKPTLSQEVVIVARHKGLANYLFSKASYRCHVWCGPMHAFEQGKLIIMPNTLLFFSLGCVAGILILLIVPIIINKVPVHETDAEQKRDLINEHRWIREMLVSRWPQIIVTIIALLMIYIVIMTTLFGTKVSGRNLGVMLMWIVWLFLLITVLTPFGGRSWCTICPLPFFGDWIQRRSTYSPVAGKTGQYNNKFFGLFLTWPKILGNNWLKIIVFMLLATFSTTMVAVPRVSGFVILGLLIVPTLMSAVWELRAFCRYVCPVSVFVNPFSKMSFTAIRNKSQPVCDQCKPKYCMNGNTNGWACPYGINVGELKENTECGMCLECLRSCIYNNISVYKRPFASEISVKNLSEAWLSAAIFTIAIVYSILYLGPWPLVRDYVNIIDKKNWDLFGIYSLILWLLSLVVVPGFIYLLSLAGKRSASLSIQADKIFLKYCGSLLPLGLLLWVSFVIPMLFVNITFVGQSLSDPFGWGWNFLGAANTPWHQLLYNYIPWIQAIIILTGLYFSLRNIKSATNELSLNMNQTFYLIIPFGIFVTAVSVFMLFFFTN